jgi:DNA repair photolyase
VTPEKSRTVITRNDSPDVPFDLSINPYKGCEHGCIYCFARPTHAYLGLSPGIDFESRIFSKPDAAERLREQLSKRGYRPQVIALGANTDPYQPAERELKITRSILEVMNEFQHPVGIVTKSNLVLRDLDLLRALAADNLVNVMVAITTLDRELARRMEPAPIRSEGALHGMARVRAGQQASTPRSRALPRAGPPRRPNDVIRVGRAARGYPDCSDAGLSSPRSVQWPKVMCTHSLAKKALTPS